MESTSRSLLVRARQGQEPAWQRIVTDRPEHVIAVIARSPGTESERQLLGFVVQQEGWALAAKEPVLRWKKAI